MDLNSLLTFFVQGTAESEAVIAVSLALYHVPIDLGTLTKVALLQTTVAFFIKLLPVTTGAHTMMILLALALSLNLCLRHKHLECLLYSLTGALLLVLVKFLFLFCWTRLFNLDVFKLARSPALRIFFGLQPPAALLFCWLLLRMLKNHPRASLLSFGRGRDSASI